MKGKEMTKSVVVRQNGKIEGIRGLYRDPRSGRYYVRYATQGIDKQLTVEPSGETFTALSKAASRGLTQLKREVGAIVDTPTKKPQKDALQEGVEMLPKTIERVWGARGIKPKGIRYYIACCDTLALCKRTDSATIHRVDTHNREKVGEALKKEGLSDCARWQLYKTINLVFTKLIQLGEHKGENPVVAYAMPKYASQREDREVTFEDMAKIIHLVEASKMDDIKRLELILFYRLLSETGQRPLDVYHLDARTIDGGHYRFKSQKTGRNQRVAHYFSHKTRALIQELTIKRGRVSYTWNLQGDTIECFWSTPWATLQRLLREYAHKALGDGIKLYTARHHFISEVFRLTDSEFWASAFTHEGKGANLKYYLHADQEEADSICQKISTKLDLALKGKHEKKVQRDEPLWADENKVYAF